MMAGGAGLEFYFGYSYPQSDLTCQDWRSRDSFWDYCRYALQFFKNNQIPFWDMVNNDSLSSNSNDYCFYKDDEVYLAYLKSGGTTNITITAGTYDVWWYNPRTGGDLQTSDVVSVTGPGSVNVGNPPSDTSQDWLVMVENLDLRPPAGDGDIDDDGDIEFQDFARYANRYGDIGCIEPNWCDGADLDRDGIVDNNDLTIIAADWLDVPAAPSGLTAIPLVSSKIDLAWTDNSDDEDGFDIERKTTAGGTYAYVDSVAANVTAYQDTGLSAETTYYYRVLAYRGNAESDYSNEIWTTTPEVDLTPPAAPTGLVGFGISTSDIYLTWQNNSEPDLAGYNLYRSTVSGFEPNLSTLVDTLITETTYLDSGLNHSTTYYYKLTAVDISDNESLPSSQISVTTQTPDLTPPAAPTGLSATATGSGSINLNWNDNSEIDLAGYNVYRSLSSGFVPDSGNRVAENVTSSDYSDSGLDPNTTYYYKVTAEDESQNESGPSNEASATTDIYTGPTPVAHWRLDEISGLTAADAIGTNHGTLRNMSGTEWIAGKYNNALDLDGLNDYVEMVGYTGITGSQNRTVSAWIKSTTGGVILSWGDNGTYGRVRWVFKAGGSDVAGGETYSWSKRVGVDLNWGAAIGTTNVLDGDWHHVAAVMDNSSLPTGVLWDIKIYVDGQLETYSVLDRTEQAMNTVGTENVEIGDWINGHHFNGIIDEVAIWDIALDASEIANIYDNGIE